MSEPVKPPSMQVMVGHGLEIFSQVLSNKLNVNLKPVTQGSIDRFVRENVSDRPLTLEGLLEDAGLLKRQPKELK